MLQGMLLQFLQFIVYCTTCKKDTFISRAEKNINLFRYKQEIGNGIRKHFIGRDKDVKRRNLRKRLLFRVNAKRTRLTGL